MEVLVRCWNDSDVVPTSVSVKWLPFTNCNSDEAQTSEHVLGQMTYLVASLTLDSARSYVMHGASFTQGMISSIPIGGSISPEGFLPSILLLVDTTEILEFKTSRDRYGDNGVSDPIGGLVFKVDLTGDEDPIDEDGDIGMGDSIGVPTDGPLELRPHIG
ncbi:hypothetical protein Tco_1113002 [Tanacetum coccineum]|uniref:Uncharacterized protein n=1 Tax=Tanacetum coccineum TaxID=301880 RepID=A0ABQ5IR58_9ASTR